MPHTVPARTSLNLRGLFETKGELKAWVLEHIDQTNLEPTLTKEQLSVFIEAAGRQGFHHVCIPITHVAAAKNMIGDTGFKMEIVTVIGFPHGNELSTEGKKQQVIEASRQGASEVDFVTNISLFRSDRTAFSSELRALVDTAKSHDLYIKMILETYYLTDRETAEMALLGELAGVDIVKTSTGFGVKGRGQPDRDPEEIGATVRAIEMMGVGVRDKSKVGIKPSGGIRTVSKLLDILAACKSAGWDSRMVRIGTSSGTEFLSELTQSD
jgi:deoxyribose-phosphate aldolase